MAAVLDTSAVTVLIRRHTRPDCEPVAEAAEREMRARRAVLAAPTVAELLIGARDAAARARVEALVDRIATLPLDGDVAALAGRLGEYVRSRGATIPLPDLLIAATALWLELPLLTCDTDFARGRRIASEDDDGSDAARQWDSLQLHPASPIE